MILAMTTISVSPFFMFGNFGNISGNLIWAIIWSGIEGFTFLV